MKSGVGRLKVCITALRETPSDVSRFIKNLPPQTLLLVARSRDSLTPCHVMGFVLPDTQVVFSHPIFLFPSLKVDRKYSLILKDKPYHPSSVFFVSLFYIYLHLYFLSFLPRNFFFPLYPPPSPSFHFFRAFIISKKPLFLGCELVFFYAFLSSPLSFKDLFHSSFYLNYAPERHCFTTHSLPCNLQITRRSSGPYFLLLLRPFIIPFSSSTICRV